MAGAGGHPSRGAGCPDPHRRPRSGVGTGHPGERVLAPGAGPGPKRGLTAADEWALITACPSRFPGLPVERACVLLEVNRGSFYRTAGRQGEVQPGAGESPTAASDLTLRAAIES